MIARGIAMIGTGHLCYACNKRFGRFLPYRRGMKDVPRFIAAMDVIGSDVENFFCPRCGAHDRERHLLMYFDHASIWEKIRGGSVLHFAPEKILTRRIAEAMPAKYIKADLFPTAADITKEDIAELSFSDGTFDIVIANHVLEHVVDDTAALSEILRVLKPGGYAILQTPYSDRLQHTFADQGIADDQSRLQAFGQEDHVRLYGKDIFAKIEQIGFESRVCTHAQVLEKYVSQTYGVNSREPFLLYQRKH
jgi:SAM-dependent methyltransferase